MHATELAFQTEYIEQAIRGAAECLQWQASDATEDGNGYPITDGGDEYTDAVAELEWLVEAVTDFVRENWSDLVRVRGAANGVITVEAQRGTDAGQAGHDFILTANRHGAGFWDRGIGARGDRLTANCRPYGEFDAEFALDEDGELCYFSALNTLIMGEYPDAERGADEFESDTEIEEA